MKCIVCGKEAHEHPGRCDEAPPLAVDPGAGASQAATTRRLAVYHLLLALLLGILLAMGAALMTTTQELRLYRNSPTTTARWDEGLGCMVKQWRKTELPASILCDVDRNGIYERVTSYNQYGQKVGEAFDANQNGIMEHGRQFGPDGRTLYEWRDDQENGWVNRQIEGLARGHRSQWEDSDGDGLLDTRTILAPDGQVLLRERDEGFGGFVRLDNPGVPVAPGAAKP